MVQIIDAVGWDCPKPIIATKKALNLVKEGEVITRVDNQIALRNLLDFGASLGYEVSYEEDGNVFVVKTVKPFEEDEHMDANDDLVVVVASDKIGEGAEELGKVLMKSFLFTQLEVDPAPKTIIFMNSGVFLTCEGSPEEETVRELEERGIEILTCGACMNFYGLSESLIVGSPSNMFSIVSRINGAGKVYRA